MRTRQPRLPGPPARSPAERLHAAAIRLLRALREEDRRSGLSGPRLSALSVVVFRGPLPMRALADAEQVRPPTMTRMVGDLERLGLVARDADPSDGRVVLVRATPRGRATLLAGRDRRVARLAAALGALPPADQRLLDRAADLIEEVARRSGPPPPPR